MSFSMCKFGVLVSVPLFVIALYGYQEALRQVRKLNKQIHSILESQAARDRAEADAHRELILARRKQ